MWIKEMVSVDKRIFFGPGGVLLHYIYLSGRLQPGKAQKKRTKYSLLILSNIERLIRDYHITVLNLNSFIQLTGE
jgi:hypothetical protein